MASSAAPSSTTSTTEQQQPHRRPQFPHSLLPLPPSSFTPSSTTNSTTFASLFPRRIHNKRPFRHVRQSLSLDLTALPSPPSTFLDSTALPKKPSITTAIIISPDSDVFPITNPDSNHLAANSDLHLRSLTLPMTAATLSRSRESPGRDSPGSPPDLTDSKSSKSSSFQSSGLPDGVSCDLSNFEDISLENIAAPFPIDKQRQLVSNSAQFYRFSPHHSRSTRDLTTGTSRTLTSVPNGHNSAARSNRTSKYQLPVPGPRSSRRPRQTPQFLNLAPQPHNRSRSPSPLSATRNFSPSARSLPTGSSSSGGTHFSSSSFQHRRRHSNLGARKTVKELEDEYDDLDEEVPEDAILSNVPISPRPPHERDLAGHFPRRAETEPISLRTSLSPNDERSSESNNSSPERSLERAESNISAASAPADLNGLATLPVSPSLSDASSDFSRPMTATKTREAALSDLSDDARDLTAALEMYAEVSELKHEDDVQAGKVKPSRALTRSSSVPTPVELPPVRKNDPLLDPLPVSKEKEKVLTRTRPSWLPPKSQKEEKKHLKQYQKMMALAAEADKKRARKAQKMQCDRDTAALARSKTWETHVLPNWSTAVNEPRTRELVWHGIPPQRRGEAWSKAVGNELGLTSQSFEAASKRAKEMHVRLDCLEESDKERDPMGALYLRLKKDASGVFPELNLFHEGGPLHEGLIDLCMAYAVYRVNLEWDFGIQTFAGLLLLNLAPSSAFITLANIFNRPLPLAILSHEPTTLSAVYNQILALLAYERPQLHAHFITLRNIPPSSFPAEQDPADISTPITPSLSLPACPRSPCLSPGPLLDPSAYLFPVLHALVTASPRLTLDAASRILDLVVFEGDAALVRATVAVLVKLESRLYTGPAEVRDELENGQWLLGDVDTLMESIRDIGKGQSEQ